MDTESDFFGESGYMVECDLGIENNAEHSVHEKLSIEALRDISNLKEIVCGKLNFNEEVYQRMLDCGMDVESLYYITDSDINELFPISMLGTRVKFKERVARWRRNEADTISLMGTCRSLINCSQPFQDSMSNMKSKNLKSILKATERGQSILRQFEEKRALSDVSRRILINAIAGHFAANGRAMTMKDVINFSEQIINLFPSEDISYYYNRRKGKNPTGKLYDKATNLRRKIKKEPAV